MPVEVMTFQDWRRLGTDKSEVVVTVSRAEGWSRGLSPFFLGPCRLWGPHVAVRMENAWQFSECYSQHVQNGKPTRQWIEWARSGWLDSKAHRYPMGRGKKPLFSWWDGKKYSYVEARKHIYIPLYFDAVKSTPAWRQLKALHEQFERDGRTLYLIDFDAYLHKREGMSYSEVVNCSERKMGHAFVLAMMLEEWKLLKRTVKRMRAERDS